MALPLVKTPNDFPFKHSGQPDKYGQSLGGNFAQVQANFDKRAEYNQTQINAIITALNSIADGDSGADNVKATTISGLTSTSVQGLLEELKLLVDTQLPTPNGSITNAKLATDVKVGSLATLLTTIKTSVVGAINELFTNKCDKITPTGTVITTGFATNWTGSIYCQVNQENLKTYSISLTKSVDISTAETIYTLPVELRPNRPSVTLINLQTTAGVGIANSFAVIAIGTNGTIIIAPVPSSTLTNARLIRDVNVSSY